MHQQQQRGRNSSGNNSYFVRGGVTQHITEECERFFCETLRAAFLGEMKVPCQDSLVMDVHSDGYQNDDSGIIMESSGKSKHNSISHYLEMFDYRGDMRFRAFVAETARADGTMFVFFESDVAGKDLKPGLVALLELASEKAFNCSEMVVCLDRRMAQEDIAATTRDLGWVGFELTTMEPWTGIKDEISHEWLFLAMET